MDVGTILYSPWVSSSFDHADKRRLPVFIARATATGIEVNGREVLREGHGLVEYDPARWFKTEAEAKRQAIELLGERLACLRDQIEEEVIALAKIIEVQA